MKKLSSVRLFFGRRSLASFKNKPMKKAQAWGLDLMMATIIFLAGLIFFYLYVLNLPNENQEIFDTLLYEGGVIGDSLLSEGFPEDWQENDVVSLGILSNGRVNDTKLANFYNLSNNDYFETRRLFNVLNNYYVFFEDPVVVDGIVINGIGLPVTNENNLVRVTRVVVHDNKIKNLNIYVWN